MCALDAELKTYWIACRTWRTLRKFDEAKVGRVPPEFRKTAIGALSWSLLTLAETARSALLRAAAERVLREVEERLAA